MGQLKPILVVVSLYVRSFSCHPHDFVPLWVVLYNIMILYYWDDQQHGWLSLDHDIVVVTCMGGQGMIM